jgi:hypothetical protein
MSNPKASNGATLQTNPAAADIVSRVRIGDVCRGLGIEPCRGRIRAPWRETADFNVSISDEKNCWHDFVTGEAGGLLDFVMKVRGGARADALRWCADLAGVPLDDSPFTAADRARWARERRALERDLPIAKYWRRTAVLLCDEKLVVLKASAFDPTADAPAPVEIADWTREQARLSRLDGATLVQVYREAARREPAVTAGMVRWARDRERAEAQALCRYLEFPQSVAATYLRGAA